MDEAPFASCRNGRPYTIGQGVVYVSALSKLFVATVSISSIQLVIFNPEISPLFFQISVFVFYVPKYVFPLLILKNGPPSEVTSGDRKAAKRNGMIKR
jgi:hypothetical protein